MQPAGKPALVEILVSQGENRTEISSLMNGGTRSTSVVLVVVQFGLGGLDARVTPSCLLLVPRGRG